MVAGEVTVKTTGVTVREAELLLQGWERFTNRTALQNGVQKFTFKWQWNFTRREMLQKS